MASATASRVSTIARLVGDITDKGTTFEESLVLTQRMILDTNPLPKPIVKFKETGETFVQDLPFDDNCGQKLHQWVDLVHPNKAAPGSLQKRTWCPLPHN